MTPRTPKQYEEIREEKKNLIMDSALEHFANEGYHATTIIHIAKHAGISKGLMYNYFRSKEELLTEIINRGVVEIYASFDTDRDGWLSGEEFEHFLRMAFNVIREKRQFWRLLTGIMLQKGVYENLFNSGMDREIDDGVTLKQFTDNMASVLYDYFRRKHEGRSGGSDPGIEMMMFINTIKGFAVTLLFAEEMYPDEIFEKTVNEIIRVYK